MKHNLHISVSKKPVNRGIVSVRNVTVRERLMRFLLGDKEADRSGTRQQRERYFYHRDTRRR